MKILNAFWQYWKWLCVALVSSCVVLGAIALLVMNFDIPEPDHHIRECIESGGTWDDGEGFCKSAG